MATAIQRRDIDHWAASQGITVERAKEKTQAQAGL
jgi:hypothetical protein